MRTFLISAAAALACAVVPGSASAARYQVFQCSEGAGKPAEVTPGFVTPLNVSFSDGCASGGQLGLTTGNNAISESGDWQIAGYEVRVPAALPNTRIVQLASTLSIAGKTGDPVLSYGQIPIVGESGTVFASNVPPGDWPGFVDHGLTGDFPAGSRFAQLYIQCYGACRFKTLPTMSVRRLAITLDDPTLPTAPKPEPTGLLDGSAQSGTRVLRFAAGDADSGVHRVELRAADGTAVASTPSGAGCSYTRPAPCPQSRPQEEISVDTSKLAAGVQALELWTVDAAGNVLKTALPAFTVAGPAAVPGTPAPPAPAPTTRTKAKVTFKVSSTKPRRRAKVTLSGKVTPVPQKGSRVVIEVKERKGWITASVTRVRTGGAFSWSHRFKNRGTYRMRARLLGTGDALVKPGTSVTRSFRVR